jgi:hypothetical protein
VARARQTAGTRDATTVGMRRWRTSGIALWTLLACGDPLAPEPPSQSPITNAPSTAGGDAPERADEARPRAVPATSTLRAPADDRREEVDPESGAAPP